MGSTDQSDEAFVSLRRAAARLGVPVVWLRTEAEADKLPSLKVGRRLLFNCAEVERVLIKRARIETSVSPPG